AARFPRPRACAARRRIASRGRPLESGRTTLPADRCAGHVRRDPRGGGRPRRVEPPPGARRQELRGMGRRRRRAATGRCLLGRRPYYARAHPPGTAWSARRCLAGARGRRAEADWNALVRNTNRVRLAMGDLVRRVTEESHLRVVAGGLESPADRDLAHFSDEALL